MNLFHDLGSIEKDFSATTAQKPENGKVWKKNVSISQVIRLQKRAAVRAENTKLDNDKKGNN